MKSLTNNQKPIKNEFRNKSFIFVKHAIENCVMMRQLESTEHLIELYSKLGNKDTTNALWKYFESQGKKIGDLYEITVKKVSSTDSI